MRSIVLCALAAFLCFGAAYAQESFMPYPMMGRGDCAALRTARNLLDLEREQVQQTRQLAEQYNKDLRGEIEKAQVALDQKYMTEVSNLLNDEQRGKLETLMAAEKTYQEALGKADKEYRAKLMELFYADEKDEEKLKAAEGLMRFLPRQEKELFQRYTMVDEGLREKHAAVRTKHATRTAKIHAEASTVDWKDLKAAREWQKKRDEMIKEADEEYLQEARALLDEDQAKVFEAALKAQAQWKEVVEAAGATYVETAEKVSGAEKSRQIKRQKRRILSGMRY